jgi:hypothetical protein
MSPPLSRSELFGMDSQPPLRFPLDLVIIYTISRGVAHCKFHRPSTCANLMHERQLLKLRFIQRSEVKASVRVQSSAWLNRSHTQISYHICRQNGG